MDDAPQVLHLTDLDGNYPDRVINGAVAELSTDGLGNISADIRIPARQANDDTLDRHDH